MAWSPVTQNETFVLTGALAQDNGQPLQNLVNVQQADLVFAPDDFAQPVTDLRFVATGAVSVNTGQATYFYQPSAGDLTKLVPGTWKIQAVITYTGGTKRFSSPIVLQVNPAL